MDIHKCLQAALLKLNNALVLPDGSKPFFTWKTAFIPCVPNMAEAGNAIVVGGKEETVSCILNVSLEHFLTADSTLVTVDSTLWTTDSDVPVPITGKKVVFRGKSYRVLTSAIDASNAYVKLVLGSANK
jgi:hypothetical protein